MTADSEVKVMVVDWLNGLVADFCEEGMVEFMRHLDMPELQWGLCRKSDIEVILINKVVLSLRGWGASCCVIIIGKEVNHLSQLYVCVLYCYTWNITTCFGLVFQYCKILPDDGPYRPKHVVLFHV
jgi:hypothetical protein